MQCLTWRGQLHKNSFQNGAEARLPLFFEVARIRCSLSSAPAACPLLGGESMARCRLGLTFGACVLWAFLVVLHACASINAAFAADDGWVVMPAGGRPAYMGIHGGTMPVSLLVAGDGASLFTFVGRTGNDFLEALRATDLPLPSLLNAASANSRAVSRGAALFAGNATSSLPVIPLNSESFAGLLEEPGKLQPFGLSDEPLSIEGHAVRPKSLSPVKSYRLFVLPQYLGPSKGQRSR